LIWIDPRIGSGELLPYFKPYDVEVEVTQLDYGDAAFYGNSSDGAVLIGVERKNLRDLITSVRTKRLSGHQLPGLFETYSVVMLVIEGVWECGPNGEIVEPRYGGWLSLRIGNRAVMYREVEHYLATLTHKCGVIVQYTTKPTQTVAWLVSHYKWWQKEWKEHQSDDAIYAPEGVTNNRHRFTGRAIGPVERVAAQLPGVDRKAYAFGKWFKSVKDMVDADEKELMEVEGIGKIGAKKIHAWLRSHDGR